MIYILPNCPTPDENMHLSSTLQEARSSRISIFTCLMFSSISAAILFRMTDFVIWMPYSICLRNLRRGFEKRV